MDVALSKTKSLCEYFEIPERVPGDVKKLLVQEIIGAGGWWYKKAMLPHEDMVYGVAFHPQGTIVATASNDKMAYVGPWAKKGTLLRALPHSSAVDAVAFHSQGNIVATASATTACLWLSKESKLVRTLHHDGWVNDVDFHPQGHKVVTASNDHTACVWGLDGTKLRTLQHNDSVTAVAFHPQGNLIATASDKIAYLWGSKGIRRRFFHGNLVVAVAFHKEGNMFATASGNTAYVWDIKRDILHALRTVRFLPHSEIVNEVAFHSQGTLIATVSHDKTACLWDLEGNKLCVLRHDNWVRAVAFHPQDNVVATASDDKLVSFWAMHNKPTLEQVLLRLVLKKYLLECIAGCQKPKVTCTHKDDLVPWMVETFKLKQDELEQVWETFPEKLKSSIVATLLYRVSCIKYNTA